jgi:hypothetical protein
LSFMSASLPEICVLQLVGTGKALERAVPKSPSLHGTSKWLISCSLPVRHSRDSLPQSESGTQASGFFYLVELALPTSVYGLQGQGELGEKMEEPEWEILFFSFFIHMCIQYLGHFSPLLPLPPLPPTPPPPSPPTPSIPSRNYFALISNFVEERV